VYQIVDQHSFDTGFYHGQFKVLTIGSDLSPRFAQSGHGQALVSVVIPFRRVRVVSAPAFDMARLDIDECYQREGGPDRTRVGYRLVSNQPF
jgi:hypothetical protein